MEYRNIPIKKYSNILELPIKTAILQLILVNHTKRALTFQRSSLLIWNGSKTATIPLKPIAERKKLI